MTTYAIDDQHGNLLTTGLQEHDARRTAQRMADSRRATVYLYALDPETAEDVDESAYTVITPAVPASDDDDALDPADYTVYDYQTGSALDGEASEGLVEASLAAGGTGAVPAYMEDDVWLPLRSDEVDHYTRQLGYVVRTVYVQE